MNDIKVIYLKEEKFDKISKNTSEWQLSWYKDVISIGDKVIFTKEISAENMVQSEVIRRITSEHSDLVMFVFTAPIDVSNNVQLKKDVSSYLHKEKEAFDKMFQKEGE